MGGVLIWYSCKQYIMDEPGKDDHYINTSGKYRFIGLHCNETC